MAQVVPRRRWWSVRACAALSILLGAIGVAAAPAQLAFMTEVDGVHRLVSWDSSGRTATIDVMSSPPLAIAWDFDRRLAATVRAEGIFVVGYAGPRVTPVRRGRGPPAGTSVIDAWFVPGTALAFRVVILSKRANAKPRCTDYLADGAAAWRTVAEQDDNDDECLAFADTRHAGARSVSSSRLMRTYACAAPGSLCDTPDSSDLSKAKRARLLKAHHTIDAVRVIKSSSGPAMLVVGIATGDTPHLHQPLFVLVGASAKMTRLPLPTSDQLQIGHSGDLIVAASEYRGEDPVVIDVATGRILFSSKGYAAIWLGESF